MTATSVLSQQLWNPNREDLLSLPWIDLVNKSYVILQPNIDILFFLGRKSTKS